MHDVTVTRTHLVHKGRAPDPVPPPVPGLKVKRLDACPVDLYRFLYAEVGRPWHWRDRDAWSDAELAAYLARRDVSLWVLQIGEGPAGWFELRDGVPDGIEIVYFGLMPKLTGRGLGRWFLVEAMTAAKRAGSGIVRLNTCTLDHPAALANYLKRGFAVERTETYVAQLPDDAAP